MACFEVGPLAPNAAISLLQSLQDMVNSQAFQQRLTARGVQVPSPSFLLASLATLSAKGEIPDPWILGLVPN